MTLPPVVSDPEVCPERPGRQPHDWVEATAEVWGSPICRYCRDRKPL